MSQLALFTEPFDERRLTDPQRTALEAIDRLGSIDATTAGEIVCRFRGFQKTAGLSRRRLLSDGYRALRRLQRLGLVRRRDGRWERAR